MAVGAGAIDVEEVGDRHFANPELETAQRHTGGQSPGAWLLGGGLLSEADDLMDFVVREVGRRAQTRVTHDVDVCGAGESERLTEAAATGAFDVENQIVVISN